MTQIDSLIPQTIVAVRDHDTAPWRMVALTVVGEELHQRLSDLVSSSAEVRFVGTFKTTEERLDQTISNCAYRRGWHYQNGVWYPIDEPMPQSNEEAPFAEVELTLVHILFGTIAVDIFIGKKVIRLGFDDIHDSLVVFVKFIQLFVAGGRPHAALADYSDTDIIIESGSDTGSCRILIRQHLSDGLISLSATTDRAALVSSFCQLASKIAAHPNLAHHFLYHVALPPFDYEKVADAADTEWADGVRQGIYIDDYDAAEEFLGARLVANIPLESEWIDCSEQCREMMRSLDIPRDWQLCFGLRVILRSDDIACIVELSLR